MLRTTCSEVGEPVCHDGLEPLTLRLDEDSVMSLGECAPHAVLQVPERSYEVVPIGGRMGGRSSRHADIDLWAAWNI